MGLDPAHRTQHRFSFVRLRVLCGFAFRLTTPNPPHRRNPRCVPQQGFSQALIKIYSLVDCPIYSVVKYRPRQLSLTTRLGGLGLFPTQCSAPSDLLEPRYGFGCRLDAQHQIGGADRDRTGGLLVANQALSQLSYSPH